MLLLSATEEELARRELQHALTMEQAAKADALAAAAAAGAAKAEVLGRLAAAEGTRKAALRRLAVQQEHKDMLAQQQVLLAVVARPRVQSDTVRCYRPAPYHISSLVRHGRKRLSVFNAATVPVSCRRMCCKCT